MRHSVNFAERNGPGSARLAGGYGAVFGNIAAGEQETKKFLTGRGIESMWALVSTYLGVT